MITDPNASDREPEDVAGAVESVPDSAITEATEADIAKVIDELDPGELADNADQIRAMAQDIEDDKQFLNSIVNKLRTGISVVKLFV